MEEVRNEVKNEEPETGKEKESKSERFIRLAEGRDKSKNGNFKAFLSVKYREL